MANLKHSYRTPDKELVITVTMHERLAGIRRIEAGAADEHTMNVLLNHPKPHLLRPRLSHVFPSGMRLHGSLTCEDGDAPGSLNIRADLHYGSGASNRHIRDEVIMHFSPHQEPEQSPGAGRGQHPGQHPGQHAHAGAAAPHGGAATAAPPVLAADADDGPPPAAETGQAPDQTEMLFPYMHLSKWPQADSDVLALAYARYQPTDAAPLFTALTANPPLTRQAMQTEALLFRAGSAPYDGLYVEHCAALLSEVRFLPKVAAAAQAHRKDPAELIRYIPGLFLISSDQMHECLASPPYRADIARVWQSYFAELILAADDQRAVQLGDYSRLLLADHLLQTLFPASVARPATVAELSTLRHAAILLPEQLFPLPAATPLPPRTVNACAIGQLQVARQKLLRYAAGELSHIENIMPGERREIRRAQAQGRQWNEADSSAADSAQELQADDVRQCLVKQAQQAIAEQIVWNKYTDFDTSYGPPTKATLNGAWTERTIQGSNPGSDEQTSFARDILQRSVSRLSRSVRQVRQQGGYAHSEDSVTSVIDNSAGAGKVVCAFRWLNKIYQASVVNHGHRLMVEFIVNQPAAAITARSGVTDSLASFAQITPDNYAALAVAYQVTGLTPPPAATRTLSLTLRYGEQSALAVPAGYVVDTVAVNYLSQDPSGEAPVVLAGREKFLPGDAPRQGFGEDTTLALCVLGHAKPITPQSGVTMPAATASASASSAPAPASPSAASATADLPAASSTTAAAPPPDEPIRPPVAPPSSPPGAPMEVLVNVVVTCRCSDTELDGWRIRTFDALVRGHQQQQAEARNPATRHPSDARSLVRRHLRQACMQTLRMLVAAHRGPAGGKGGPHADTMADPWLQQFIDELFEWSHMNIRLLADGADLSPQDPGAGSELALAEFQEADTARVLLPVAPAHEAALLYFLANGLCWDGDPDLAPVDGADAALLLELRRLRRQRHEHQVGPSWEVTVPTAMQVLDDDFSVVMPGDQS
jgi:hypothetical protein